MPWWILLIIFSPFLAIGLGVAVATVRDRRRSGARPGDAGPS